MILQVDWKLFFEYIKKKKTYVFIYWLCWVLTVAHGMVHFHCSMQDLFTCSMQILGCGTWDLVPWPGIEPEPPALGVWSLSHWTTREVPGQCFWQGLFLLRHSANRYAGGSVGTTGLAGPLFSHGVSSQAYSQHRSVRAIFQKVTC